MGSKKRASVFFFASLALASLFHSACSPVIKAFSSLPPPPLLLLSLYLVVHVSTPVLAFTCGDPCQQKLLGPSFPCNCGCHGGLLDLTCSCDQCSSGWTEDTLTRAACRVSAKADCEGIAKQASDGVNARLWDVRTQMEKNLSPLWDSMPAVPQLQEAAKQLWSDTVVNIRENIATLAESEARELSDKALSAAKTALGTRTHGLKKNERRTPTNQPKKKKTDLSIVIFVCCPQNTEHIIPGLDVAKAAALTAAIADAMVHAVEVNKVLHQFEEASQWPGSQLASFVLGNGASDAQRRHVCAVPERTSCRVSRCARHCSADCWCVEHHCGNYPRRSRGSEAGSKQRECRGRRRQVGHQPQQSGLCGCGGGSCQKQRQGRSRTFHATSGRQGDPWILNAPLRPAQSHPPALFFFPLSIFSFLPPDHRRRSQLPLLAFSANSMPARSSMYGS